MKRMVLLLLVLLSLSGCTGATSADVSGFAPEEAQRLTVLTCLEESLCEPLVNEFQERTGIWVSLETGTAPELIQRVQEDPDCCDLLLGCGSDALYASGIATVQQQDLSLLVPVIVYNPRLIRQNPPSSLADLLNPDWQGKIAFADPDSSGFSQSLLWILAEMFPEQSQQTLLSALQGNLSGLLTDSREVAARVGDGTYCLAVVPEDTALSAIASGDSLTMVYPQEGAFRIPDCAAIPAGAVHLENARAFLEFCLSVDTQRHLQDYYGRRSVLAELESLPENPVSYDAAAAGAGLPQLLDLWHRLWEGTS